MWIWLGCVPAETEREALAVAAASLVTDVMARLTDENIASQAASGVDHLTFTESDEVTDPDWAGTLTTAVTWAGDPEGACACRGDCAASAWTFSSAVDLRFRHDTNLSWCEVSDAAPPADPPDLDLTGTLSGAGGLGPFTDDIECLAGWPAWTAAGSLQVIGLTDHDYDVAVTIVPNGARDEATVTVDDTTWSWSWSCGV